MKVLKYIFLIAAVMTISGIATGVWANSAGEVGIQGRVFPGEDRKQRLSSERAMRSPQHMNDSPVITLNVPELKTSRRYVKAQEPPRRKIGAVRVVDALSDFQGVGGILEWKKTDDGGHTALVFISSPRARAVRAGIIINALPDETECRFFPAPEAATRIPPILITGEQINRLLERNMEMDASHPDARTFWSPTVPGDRIGMEFYLPSGVDPARLEIAMPFVSHIEESPYETGQESRTPLKFGDSNPCQNDATCYPGWQDTGNAVAKMVFTESGDSYTCTGTLLNDSDEGTWIPYFITANHCIGSQTVASTLETHWFYESAACNSTIQNPDYTVRYGGADLLWTKGYSTSPLDGNQDVSFLRLYDTPPAGAMFAGWHTAMDENPVFGVHHPEGDWKKISFGNPEGHFTCYGPGDEYECTPSTSGSFLNVVWTDGGTQTGSSGSGIFNADGQLLGTLLGGGGGDCAGSDSDYSWFGAAYSAGGLSRWLDPLQDAVFGTVVLSGSRPGITLPAGSDAVIYGTAAPNHIILESGARAMLINFPGPNTLEIRSNPDLFTVSRSGTVVTFQGPDSTTLKIPATTDEQTIVFNDKDPFKLRIHQGRVMLDDRVIFTTGRTIYAK